jgi:hypothetical protein
MSPPNDLSRSLAALEQDNTLIAVIEMSQASWLVAGIVPGLERHPLKSSRRTKRRCSGCCTSGCCTVGGTRRPRLAGP